MELSDILEGLVSTLQGLQLDQVALLAGVTIVAAGILYVLLDALRYRAIPDLNVPLTEGGHYWSLNQQGCGQQLDMALTELDLRAGCCCTTDNSVEWQGVCVRVGSQASLGCNTVLL